MHNCRHIVRSILLFPLCALISCTAQTGELNPRTELGRNPDLTAPSTPFIPTVNPAKGVGWPAQKTPTPAAGYAVNAFATGLDHPRWLHVLPNGDVLVAESNQPADEGGFSGIEGWFANRVKDYAGAGVASADRITLLRDADGDGRAETQSVFLENLRSPFGMALVADQLYIGNAGSLVRVPYEDGAVTLSAQPETVAELPGGPLNHHWTKNILASPDGERIYVAAGSNSNIGENGLEHETDRAAILAIDVDTGERRIFASGLRNPVGMAWHPETGALWTVVNERDELGDQLVPDYLTSVREGDFFGWPYSYWGSNVDTRVDPKRPDLVAKAREPDYALGAHTASLGLTFYNHTALPALEGTAIVGQHGSWNRSDYSGYAVVAVPFKAGEPVGVPMDVITGFLSDEGQAYGRPVGVAVTANGDILVADDVGNTIWRVSPNPG